MAPKIFPVFVLLVFALACSQEAVQTTPAATSLPNTSAITPSPVATQTSAPTPTAAQMQVPVGQAPAANPTVAHQPPTPTPFPTPSQIPTATPRPMATPTPTQVAPEPTPTPTTLPVPSPTASEPTPEPTLALTMVPTPEPTLTPVPLLPDTRAINWVRINAPNTYQQLADLPWVKDGVSYDERLQVDLLARVARVSPELAATAISSAWAQDGLDEADRDYLGLLGSLHDASPEIGRALNKTEWVGAADKRSSTEVLRDFRHIVNRHPDAGPSTVLAILEKPWMQDSLTQEKVISMEWMQRVTWAREWEVVPALLEMPFAETFEPEDSFIFRAVGEIYSFYADTNGKAFKESDTYKDGIGDDDLVRVVAALSMQYPDELERMLEPGWADVEEWRGDTHLTPDLKISIVRAHSPRLPGTMDGIIEAVNFLERLMDAPLPGPPHLIIIFHDESHSQRGSGLCGQHRRFAVVFCARQEEPTDNGSGREMLQSVVIHEMGHKYFGWPMQSWLHHFFVIMYEVIWILDGREIGDVPEELLGQSPRRDCDIVDLKTLEEVMPTERYQTRCHHHLGHRMAREIVAEVGMEEFITRMQKAYPMKDEFIDYREDPGIEVMRLLYPDQSEIVERFWSGRVNAPENLN